MSEYMDTIIESAKELQRRMDAARIEARDMPLSAFFAYELPSLLIVLGVTVEGFPVPRKSDAVEIIEQAIARYNQTQVTWSE